MYIILIALLKKILTEKMINGNLLHLNNPKSFKKILKNKIVLIESADWIRFYI